VSGVDATDLLINGVPATTVSGGRATTFIPLHCQASLRRRFNPVAASHGITDFDSPPKSFDGNAVGSNLAVFIAQSEHADRGRRGASSGRLRDESDAGHSLIQQSGVRVDPPTAHQ